MKIIKQLINMIKRPVVRTPMTVIEEDYDFTEKQFRNPRDCPIARSIKRSSKRNDVIVGMNFYTICGELYFFPKSISDKVYQISLRQIPFEEVYVK